MFLSSVDIIIPNYQYGRYLRECVASVLSQGIEQLRVLIVDNASTDDSVEVALALAARDSRIQVRVHPVNLGFHASVNEGLDWAESTYVMVLCADDLIPPNTLKRALAVLEANPAAAFAYGSYVSSHGSETINLADTGLDAAWQIRSGTEFIAQCCTRMIHAMAPLVRTEIQKKAGHYRQELRITSDLEILLRLACFGDVAVTPAIQGIQRIHHGNISVASWGDPLLGINAELAIFDTFFSNEGKSLLDASKMHRQARRHIAKRIYWRAVGFGIRGRRKAALGLLKLAVRLAPDVAIIPPLRHLRSFDRPVSRAVRMISRRLMPGLLLSPLLKRREQLSPNSPELR
jgi:glycosyltransferase involved in cell wall biosynthesis